MKYGKENLTKNTFKEACPPNPPAPTRSYPNLTLDKFRVNHNAIHT